MWWCSILGPGCILLLLVACFITFCVRRALQQKTATSMYYLLYALPIFAKWKWWTNFNLRFKYRTYAIRILKPKFENSNFRLTSLVVFFALCFSLSVAFLLSLICDVTGCFSRGQIGRGVKPSMPVGKRPYHHEKIDLTSFTGRKVHKSGQNNHHLEKTYSCIQCDKCFSSESGLRAHMNIHSKKHKCTECGKCYGSSYYLAEHMRSHSGEKPFECTVCNKRFTISSNLDVHSRIHSGEKPFVCNVCSKRFATSGNLSVHSRIHSGDKPYKCHVCDKEFSVSESLNIHMRLHTGDKPYNCSLCNKSFTTSSNLQSHKRHVHSNIRPYDCPYCGKLFTTNSERKRHVRTHTGAKPYSCRQCSERFTWHHKLKVHLLKSHNEGTWFTCHICQKKYSHRGNLNKHVRTHEGVKTSMKPWYYCTECLKHFHRTD